MGPVDSRAGGAPHDGGVRSSEFWQRMNGFFGPGYAPSVARDQVIAELGGRTVEEALAAGLAAQEVWRAVCACFEVPARLR
jgi:hypothetical protein